MPGLRKGKWSKEEDQLLMRLAVASGATIKSSVHSQYATGSNCVGIVEVNWPELAAHIPGRTSKQVRERWYEHLSPGIKRGAFSAEEEVCCAKCFCIISFLPSCFFQQLLFVF